MTALALCRYDAACMAATPESTLSRLRFHPTVDPETYEVWTGPAVAPHRLGRVFKVGRSRWMNNLDRDRVFRFRRRAGLALLSR